MKPSSVFLSVQALANKRVIACCLAFLLILFAVPSAAFADQPDPAEPGGEVCTVCHWSETSQWQHSPHANEGIKCEECHGDLSEGHPDDNEMPMPVGATVCQDCHETTVAQWNQSLHSGEDVNCVDCHVPHSQTTRLNAEQLCVSCHDDDVGITWDLTGHKMAGVSCVDCHVSTPVTGAEAIVEGTVTAPNHSFIAVPSHLCINCHAENLHQPSARLHGDTAQTKTLASYAERTNVLNQQLKETEDQNKSLQNWTLIALGLGLGIGLFLGLVLMLSMNFVCARTEKRS